MKAFLNNIETLTLENNFYRRVLFTGQHEQLVVMSLLPGEDIGEEVHDIDQFFRFESGQGRVVLNGKEYKVEDGSGVIVPSGVKHNIVNISNSEPLKLYTIYSEPQHPKGAKYKTKEEAEMKEKKVEKSTKVKKKDKTPEQTKKYDRCVKHVKEQGGDANPYAVCQSSVLGNTKDVKKGYEDELYDAHQDDIADEEYWKAKYNKYYGKDKKIKGENEMTEEPIEKAWKKFKKSYNGIAGYTQDEVDNMSAKDYARAKDKSIESAIPRRRELAEKKKKEGKKV